MPAPHALVAAWQVALTGEAASLLQKLLPRSARDGPLRTPPAGARLERLERIGGWQEPGGEQPMPGASDDDADSEPFF